MGFHPFGGGADTNVVNLEIFLKDKIQTDRGLLDGEGSGSDNFI